MMMLRSFTCGCVLALATNGCGASPPPPVESKPAAQAGAEVPAPQADVSISDLAVGFLEAFRSGELASARPFVCPTFQFGTTARVNPCPSNAKTPQELERLLGCVRADSLLKNELEHVSSLAESVEPLSELPKWAVPLVPVTERQQSAASAYINGDGVTFSFVLLSQPRCIDWFLLETYYESG